MTLSTLEKFSIGLAIALLLCLVDMPYGYYTLVRYATFIIAIAWSVNLWNQRRIWAWVSIAIAGLFQPFFKMVLGRELWAFVDLLVVVFIVILLIKNHHK